LNSKYGDAHRQLRALTILDALMQNAGSRFQKRFADEMLLERLRILPTDDLVDLEVRQKCNQLYRGWAQTYKDTPGMQQIASLYKQLPKKQRPAASQSKVIRETEREAQENPFGTEEELVGAPTSQGAMATPSTPPPSSRRTSVAGPSTPTSSSSPAQASHSRTPSKSQSVADPEYASGGGIWGHHTRKSKHKHSSSTSSTQQGKAKVFSLEKEKPAMLSAIAQSSIASTNLLNSMRHLNRETSRVSEDTECLKRFETCKALRRQILRYIQLVESEQWIGSLLNANDELVKALIAFEVADKSVDDDSDSENETEMVNDEHRGLVLRPKEGGGGSQQEDEHHQHHQHQGHGKRESVGRAAMPPSAPQSRRTSLADKGAAPPPPKPPRPTQLPPVETQRRGVAGQQQQQHHAPQPTPISEGNEDDPFGDRNAF